MRTGELGYWWRSIGGQPSARPSLPGPTQADVVFVGAGYTGLWTAYYLKRAQPSLEIVVLERERAGFGASGRKRRLGVRVLLRSWPCLRARAAHTSHVVRGIATHDVRHGRRDRDGLARARWVGEGVAAANLAGRTLRDLMLDAPGTLTTLPWVGRHPRRWEPEPLRWGAFSAPPRWLLAPPRDHTVASGHDRIESRPRGFRCLH
jgi:glycine/D-amino acid oxidase-like deaminating enzyme